MIREANWAEVRAKAFRIYHSGGVHPEVVTPEKWIGKVDGDSGTYQVFLDKSLGEAGGAGSWECTCLWGRWNWYMKRLNFRGRRCSHAFAAALWWGRNKPKTWEESTGYNLAEEPRPGLLQDPAGGPSAPIPPSPKAAPTVVPGPDTQLPGVNIAMLTNRYADGDLGSTSVIPGVVPMLKEAQATFVGSIRNTLPPTHPLYDDAEGFTNALKEYEEDYLPRLMYSGLPVRDQYNELQKAIWKIRHLGASFSKLYREHPDIDMMMGNQSDAYERFNDMWKWVYNHFIGISELVKERLLSSKDNFGWGPEWAEEATGVGEPGDEYGPEAYEGFTDHDDFYHLPTIDNSMDDDGDDDGGAYVRHASETLDIPDGPDEAEDGKCYRVLWAEGMAYQAFKSKAIATKFAKECQGEDDLCSFTYMDMPKDKHGHRCGYDDKKHTGMLTNSMVKEAPFKSPKSEIYLRLNHPDVYRKWLKKYGHAPGFREYVSKKMKSWWKKQKSKDKTR